jgi:hypothetical protein
MLDFTDNELYAKIIVGLTGIFATIIKIRDSFSTIKKKQELKLDLEILEKLESKKDLEVPEIIEKIKENLKKSYTDYTDRLTNFFIGITFFIACGFWTIDLIIGSKGFNGWIILSLSLALIGFSLIFDNNEKFKEKEVFLKIGFYDKENFRVGVFFTVFASIISILLVWKMNRFSFWQVIPALFALVGFINVLKNIRRLKN